MSQIKREEYTKECIEQIRNQGLDNLPVQVVMDNLPPKTFTLDEFLKFAPENKFKTATVEYYYHDAEDSILAKVDIMPEDFARHHMEPICNSIIDGLIISIASKLANVKYPLK